MEDHLERLFEEGAIGISKRITGKICSYTLEPMGYTTYERRAGTCQILGVLYDPGIDCNLYVIRDRETGARLAVCEFEIRLQDM